MARSLAGLTLLEAAAVPGETLAADAVANAIAPVFHAAPTPGRIAVAMSGGVDSAVALLRARPDAIGVTLRLWLDPAGPDSERACCSPDAVIRARQTCHALGLPHVTLDLREAFRDAVVRPFVAGYETGLTPNPCMRCNGSFRFDALVAFADRAGADVALDRALRTRRRAGRSTPRRARSRCREGPVVHAGDARPGRSRSRRLPARRDDEDRGARGGVRRRARRCASTGEPGGVLPRGWRLSGVPLPERRGVTTGADRRRSRRRRGTARRAVAIHARPAARDRRRVARAALRAPLGRRGERARRRPAQRTCG